MCRVYGYARVSTKSQVLQRQIDNIREYNPDAVIFAEKFTGTKLQGRVELDKLIKKVKPGDTIIFDEVSRMSRNAEEGMQLYENMFNAGVNLVFLKDGEYNTERYRQKLNQHIALSANTGSHATNNFITAISEALTALMIDLAKEDIYLAFSKAEGEAARIRQRVSEGMAKSEKRPGIEAGRKLTTKKSVEMKEKIRKMSKDFGGSMTDKEVIETLKIARNTFYKYKKQLAEELNQ